MELSDNNLDFLVGGGKTGALMRALDWSASPLGEATGSCTIFKAIKPVKSSGIAASWAMDPLR